MNKHPSGKRHMENTIMHWFRSETIGFFFFFLIDFYYLMPFFFFAKEKGQKERRRSAQGRFFRESRRWHRRATVPCLRLQPQGVSVLDGAAWKNPHRHHRAAVRKTGWHSQRIFGCTALLAGSSSLTRCHTAIKRSAFREDYQSRARYSVQHQRQMYFRGW